MYVCMHACMHAACMYVCMYMCICMYSGPQSRCNRSVSEESRSFWMVEPLSASCSSCSLASRVALEDVSLAAASASLLRVASASSDSAAPRMITTKMMMITTI